METIGTSTVVGEWTLSPAAAILPTIEGYEVEALVGRGGMGRVYRARQLSLGRVVAIKLLASEPDGYLLARFREEARAVARLQHPNIAQLFETGLSEGRPFYTQEFLEGGSLAHFLGGRPQDPRFAAETVEVIARAIQHSHEHGILHRDLKPANILLTAERTPKVADFGLAKNYRTSADFQTQTTDGSVLTRTGDVLGTPAYMPPEQASGVVASLGPPADVYGLGAILYEMLAGRPPFQAPDSMQTLLMVLTMEPVSPRTLQPKVPKDLETICLKCLEKSPARRYASAKELGDDLVRFLRGEPIVARPVGLIERAVKWARRRKAAAALLAVSFVAALLLSAAGIALAIGYVRLRSALGEAQSANGQLEEKNAQLEAANEAIQFARNETQRTLDTTLASVDRYFFDFSDELKSIPGGQSLRRTIADEARNLLDQLGRLRPNDPVIRNYRASGYGKLGSAEATLGRYREGIAAYEKSREILSGLVAEFPLSQHYRYSYALTALTLANKFEQIGELAKANPLYAESFALSDELIAKHPDDLAIAKLAEQVALNRFSKAFAEAGREELGSKLQKEKDDAAELALRKTIAISRRVAALNPSDPSLQLNVIEKELSLSALCMLHGRMEEAESLILSAKAAVVDRVPAKPSLRERDLIASIWSHLAQLHNDQMRPLEAESDYGKARGVYESLGVDFPKNPLYPFQVARCWLNAGNVGKLDMRPDDARANYGRSIEILRKLVKDYPDNSQFQNMLEYVEEALKSLPTSSGKKP